MDLGREMTSKKKRMYRLYLKLMKYKNYVLQKDNKL